MDIGFLLDLVLNLDKHLGVLIRDYGAWTYLILFLIVFCETGLVVAPFLPGDSLLFASGALAAAGAFDIVWLFLLLTIASILGDNVNYWIGNYIGPNILWKRRIRFINREHLDRTERFYEKHGAKTLVYAKFMPIIRTFAPFVAGIGGMRYHKFLAINVFSALLWNTIFTLGGYYFGNIPFIKANFTLVIMAIIVVSLIPAGYEFLRHIRQKNKKRRRKTQ